MKTAQQSEIGKANTCYANVKSNIIQIDFVLHKSPPDYYRTVVVYLSLFDTVKLGYNNNPKDMSILYVLVIIRYSRDFFYNRDRYKRVNYVRSETVCETSCF